MTKKQLQGRADAAALAGSLDQPDEGPALSEVLAYAGSNMAPQGHGQVLRPEDIAFAGWDQHDRAFAAGAAPADAVRVTVRRSESNGNPVDTHFARLIGVDQVDVETSSVATIGNPSVGLLILDPNAQASLDLGNGVIEADGCVARVNSDHASAVDGNLNGSLGADATCIVGGHTSKPGYAPMPETGCPPFNDPLSYLEPPEFNGCDENHFSISSGSSTINPGVYCGGIDATTNGTLTFNPGLYVIKNGALKAAGGARLVGNGVSFYVVGSNAHLNLAGSASMDLSAPLTGPMAGILFFGDRSLNPSIQHTLKGGGDFNYEGTIYFPTTDVLFTGNGTAGATSSYSFFIARRIELGGNGLISINANCDDSDVPIPPRVGPERAGLVQ